MCFKISIVLALPMNLLGRSTLFPPSSWTTELEGLAPAQRQRIDTWQSKVWTPVSLHLFITGVVKFWLTGQIQCPPCCSPRSPVFTLSRRVWPLNACGGGEKATAPPPGLCCSLGCRGFDHLISWSSGLLGLPGALWTPLQPYWK